MSTVTLTHIRSGFRNIADRFVLGSAGDEQEGCFEGDYVIPAGYEVSATQLGEPMIYDATGDYCAIISTPDGRPALHSNAASGLVLDRA